MTTSLVVPSAPSAAVSEYRAASVSERTRRAYGLQWSAWQRWADAHDVHALPAAPSVVEAWVSEQARAGVALSTIRLRLAVLSRAHMAAGHPSPTGDPQLRSTLRGIARVHGAAQRQAAPLLVEHVRTAVHRLMGKPGPWALRDRAALLVGWSCGLRVSELVGLAVQDVDDDGADRVVIHLRRSKVDQEGKGRSVRLARGSGLTDPVAALREWRAARSVLLGPVGSLADVDGPRTALWLAQPTGRVHLGAAMAHDAVTRMVKSAAEAQGLDARRFSSHSLRRGLVTSLLAAGRSVVQVQALTGHRSVASVSRYADGARLLEQSPAEGLGL